MRRLVILGGSGIGMIAASIADVLGKWEVMGFLNDVLPVGSTVGRFRKLPVIGTTNDLGRYLDMPDVDFFIAYVGLSNEKATYEKISGLPIPPDRFATLIHPSAVVPTGYVGLGDGVLIGPLSQLSPDSQMHDNSILLGNSFLGHDSVLERFAHLATNAVVGANVRVGRAVHVGSNATVREKVDIGDFALVGAGSVVVHDVPENAVVVGNPAKVLRQR